MREIEMKRRLSSVRIMALLFGISILSACTADDMGTSGKKEGSGSVSLDLNADATYSKTKTASAG